MIRSFRAIAWLRWRILINSVKTGRRDNLEWMSRVSAAVTPILVLMMMVPAAIGIGALAFAGGRVMGDEQTIRRIVVIASRVLMAVAMAAVLFAPLVRSIQGAQVNLSRLLLLPIRRRVLFLSEVFAGLTDPWLLMTVPALLLLPLGLMLGGEGVAGLLALAAGLVLLLVLALLGTLSSFVVMLVFRNRRRAELLTLILVLVLSTIGFVFPLVENVIERHDQGAEPASKVAVTGDTGFHKVLAWGGGLPSELYGKTLALGVEGNTAGAIVRLSALMLTAVILFVLSSAIYNRLVENPESGSSRRSSGPARLRTGRIPGLSVRASAVARVHARATLRTVRGKTAVYFVAAFVILMYFLVSDELARLSLEFVELPLGPFVLAAGVGFTFLSLQPILMNQFAVDGAGLTLEFLAPISNREMVLGKIVGCGRLAGISAVLCLVAALILVPGGHWLYWASMMLVCLSAYLLLAPVASVLSVVLPKNADLSRMGRAGNPHALAAVLGMLVTAVSLFPPMVLFTTGLLLVRSPVTTFIFLCVWSAIAAGVAVLLVGLGASALDRRRENLLMITAGR